MLPAMSAWTIFAAAGLGALVCVSAVAQSKNIHEDVDPYNGRKTLFLEVATRACPGDPKLEQHDPVVTLLFSASQRPDGGVAYFLTPELDYGNSLNVAKKGTMDVLIDGEVGEFRTPAGSTVGTAYERNGGRSYLHETIPFAVNRMDFVKLSKAGNFQFRVNGARARVQRCTDAKHMQDLQEFLDAAAMY